VDHRPAAEARLAALRNRVAQLERDEEGLLTKLEQIRAEKNRSQASIIDTERALSPSARGRRGVAEHSFRRAVRELGTFTPSELAAELGCSKQSAKKHIDELVEAEIIKPAGRLAGKPMFEYVKPTEAGEAFDAQQHRPTIKLPTPEQVQAREVARARPHDIRQSRISGVRDKEIRKVVREAQALGWELQQHGRTGHVFRLVRDTDSVSLPSTPRDSDAAADMLRQRLGIRGVRATA
jgi:bacterioferritin-associated ferredoxin